MNPLWILAAFIFGALISRIGLPPLVGYLLAGFALNSIGVAGSELLETVADAGVTLLLFTIGLPNNTVSHEKICRRLQRCITRYRVKKSLKKHYTFVGDRGRVKREMDKLFGG